MGDSLWRRRASLGVSCTSLYGYIHVLRALYAPSLSCGTETGHRLDMLTYISVRDISGKPASAFEL